MIPRVSQSGFTIEAVSEYIRILTISHEIALLSLQGNAAISILVDLTDKPHVDAPL
ncbi:MAG: hypothetical protein QG577_1303 [Thermodesulfobacteriota bacterium]|nr:hypothetical protein [Thermodesulfobacteriota bacterium]